MHIQLSAYDAFGQLWVTITQHDEGRTGGYWQLVVRRQVNLEKAASDMSTTELLVLLAQICGRASTDASVWPATDGE